MSSGTKKVLSATKIKQQAIQKMLESLITGNPEEASVQLHEYLQLKTRELIIGESSEKDEDEDDKECDDDKVDDKDDKDDDKDGKEDVKETVTHHPDGAMSRTISGLLNFENGGKKTLKKHDNSTKELDGTKVVKTKFKSGGKQPAKTLEKTPKPEKFNDGRSKDLGTTKS